MVLTIGQLPISYLGGPDYLRVIEPTKKLSKICKPDTPTHHFPPMLLLGDNHSNRNFTCRDVPDCMNKHTVCLSTMSSVWFRLLDTLAFENQQVDYFIEANIYFKYINDTDLLTDEEKSITAFNIANSPLTYIPNYHAQCFQTKDKQLCITQNIRYHVCDVRMYTDYVNYTPNQRNLLAITNLLMRYGTLTQSEAYIRAKSWFDNPQNALQILSKYNIPAIEMDLPFYPYFESYLHYVMHKCLSLARTQYQTTIGMDFFGYSGVRLWTDFLTSPTDFIKSMINHPKFMTHSIIIKQLKHHSFDIDKVKDLFVAFFLHYMSVCQLNEYSKQTVADGITNYAKDTNEYHKNKTKLRGTLTKSSIYDTFEMYEAACDDLCTNIFMPFTDFYMWVRSTKDSLASTSVLSVFNAGSHHTTFFSQFMVDQGYYRHKYQGGDENKDCHPTIPVRFHVNRPLKYVLQTRCIQFVNDFSIDDMVYKRYEDSAVEDHQSLISTRLTVLGIKRYLQMLRGKPFTPKELLTLANMFGMTPKDMKVTLQLDSILLPSTYTNR